MADSTQLPRMLSAPSLGSPAVQGEVTGASASTPPGKHKRALDSLKEKENIDPVTDRSTDVEVLSIRLTERPGNKEGLKSIFANAKRAPCQDLCREQAGSIPRRTVSEAHVPGKVESTVQNEGPEQKVNGDAGDAGVDVNGLFREAEETAERAVKADEEGEHADASKLYCTVIDLYSKVIPFLSREDGLDVGDRIKMYARRRKSIRRAESVQKPWVLETTPTTPEAMDRFGFQNAEAGQMQSSSIAGATTKEPHGAGGTQASEKLTPQKSPRKADCALDGSLKTPGHLPSAKALHGSTPEEITRSPRTPWTPCTPSTPRTPRRGPPRRFPPSTTSPTRACLEEMQKRVKAMQDCLYNFTVKKKHLGPARALELQLTTLNANTFGSLKRLEPLPAHLEHEWATGLEILLPMLREEKEPRLGAPPTVRADVAMHLPVIEGCDASVRETLRGFGCLKGLVDYAEAGSTGKTSAGSRGSQRWWVQTPVVRKGGLPDAVRATAERARDAMQQSFNSAHAANGAVVQALPVPPAFLASLPRNARGLIPRDLRDALAGFGPFSIGDFLHARGLWTRSHARDIASRLERVALVWGAKASGSGRVRGRKRLQRNAVACHRCRVAVAEIRRRWPTMAHTDLDAAKIEANGDFAAAGLEAYSRAVESRAWRVLERVEELLAVDDEAKGGKADDRAKGVRWEEDLPAPWADEQGDRVCGERVEGGDSVDSGSLWSSVGEQVGFLRGRGDRGGARTRRSGRSAV